MRFISFLIILIWTQNVFSTLSHHTFKIGDKDLTYYTVVPSGVKAYPLLLICDGSYTHDEGPKSVRKLIEGKDYFYQLALLDLGLLAMERRGVCGESIDSKEYHKFNFPQQRLLDHLELIKHVQLCPPLGWNGKLIILGASEGGPLAICLAKHSCITPEACIPIVGCGDQTFKEYIWQHITRMPYFQASKSRCGCIKKIVQWFSMKASKIPCSRTEYDKRCEAMNANPDPNKFWYGQTHLYWSKAMELNEEYDFLELKCPSLVISGAYDLGCEATDRLVQKAFAQKNDVRYLRIPDAGHFVSHPKFGIIGEIGKYIHGLSEPSEEKLRYEVMLDE